MAAGQLRIARPTRSPFAMPRATSPHAMASEIRSSSAKVKRSSPETTASLSALSAQNARKNSGSVPGKFSTMARPASSRPTTSRPPGPTTLASSSSKRRSSSLGMPCLTSFAFASTSLMRRTTVRGKSLQAASDNSHYLAFPDLGLSPVALHIGSFDLRWYSLAYLAGIFIGYWYLLKLLKQPGAPLARRHADDLVFYAALGIILGGRIGYVLFYNLAEYLRHPIEIVKLWDGGMSFHGGVIGTSLGIFYFARKEKLSWLRIHDYVACCVPFGLFFGRLANFVNQELWGAPTTVPWAVRFVEMTPFGGVLGPPRHPSQIYEAILEGIVLFAILWWMFWRTEARYQPGKLVGAFIFFYGCFRFGVEFIREPDSQLREFAAATHLHMGQWLSLPMILGGLYLMATAPKRRVRVESTAGTASVA